MTTDSYISIDVGQAHATGIYSPAIVASVVTVAIGAAVVFSGHWRCRT
jgi:hypothetical protein